MTATFPLRLALGVVIPALMILTPPAARGQDTRIRIDSTPGAWPGNVHVDATPLPSAITISTSGQRGLTVRYAEWRIEFEAPSQIPFGVGVYDSAVGSHIDASHLPLIQVQFGAIGNSKPFGSFEVRQLKRDASGKVTRLWVTFAHRVNTSDAPPLLGEIRWNADTSLYLRCPNLVTGPTGDSVSFAVSGVDTHGRPVTLSASALPSGATFSGAGGTALLRWPAIPGIEGWYPIHFAVANDLGAMDTSTTYVRVRRPFSMRLIGEPSDPVTGGVPAFLNTSGVTVRGTLSRPDSTVSIQGYAAYHSFSWEFRPPVGVGLLEGTYDHLRFGTPGPHEGRLLVAYDGRLCANLESAVIRVRRCRATPSGDLVSLWAEVEQRCAGSTGRLLGEIRYNCDTTLDIQAPGAILLAEGEPVAFTVTSRTADGIPPRLEAIAVPSGAVFTDRGDGTGSFEWSSARPAGTVVQASFVAVTEAGARDTVVTRILPKTPFRVTLTSPTLGWWMDHPLSFDPSSGTLTISEASDSTLSATIRGEGRAWTIAFSAPGRRRLTTGVYDSTVHDLGFASSRPRVRAWRDDHEWLPCSDSARFQVRRLSRAPDGGIRSLWVTFSIGCPYDLPALTGEIVFNADTTLIVTAPGELSRPVHTPFRFDMSATESSGRPTIATLLNAPAGATLVDHGDGTSTFDWTSGAEWPGLTRVGIRTARVPGPDDTTVVVLRAHLDGSLVTSSTPDDPVGQGLNEAADATTSYFEVQHDTNHRVTTTILSPAGYWIVGQWAPEAALLGPGLYTGASTCASCTQPGSVPRLDVGTDGRACAAAGSFDVRRVRYAPDGSIRSLWVQFEQSCNGVGRLWGDLRYGADTSVYLRVPRRLTTEVHRAMSVPIAAVDTRGLPVSLRAESLPAGSTLEDHDDGTASYHWQSGAPSPGVVSLTWIATSNDGSADTATTTIEAFRTALFTVKSSPQDPVGRGLDLRLTGSEGAVSAYWLSDSAVAVRFVGSGHNFSYVFELPFEGALRPGLNTGARRYLSTRPHEPGMEVDIDGRNCSMDSASFHVRRLRRDGSGAIASLWLTFGQRCVGSAAGLSGEIRISADTSMYIEAPAVITRLVGEPAVFQARSVDTRGMPITLDAIDLAPGVTFNRSSPSTGEVVWDAADSAGSIRRVTFVARSEDGTTDTVFTQVRTFARDRIHISSAPDDVIGLGRTWDLLRTQGDYRVLVQPFTAALQIDWLGRDDWHVLVTAPRGHRPTIGRVEGAVSASVRGVGQPGLDVGCAGRGCNPVRAAYQIRKFQATATGAVTSLWMTFEFSCDGGPGLTGEVWFGAPDTSYFIDGPAHVTCERGNPVSFGLSAHGVLADATQWSLVRSPPGGSIAVDDEGVARFHWPGGITPGDYPVTVQAANAVASDTITTWVHVASPSFVTIRSGSSYMFPQGLDRWLTDWDGELQAWSNPDHSISFRYVGAHPGFQIDFSRASHERFVVGEYPVTGPIPPWGSSPNGYYFVWGGSAPTLSTGAFQVHEVSYTPDDVLQSLWVTFDIGLYGTSARITGEIHVYGPDLPTSVGASLIEARWTGHSVLVRGHAPIDVGSALEVQRCVESGGWTSRGTIVVERDGGLTFEDRDVQRGARNGYRLMSSDGVPSPAVWIQVPAAPTLSVDVVGGNPGRAPIRIMLSMPSPGAATVELIDVAGRVIDRQRLGALMEGPNTVVVHPTIAPAPGLYFLRVQAAERSVTRRIAVVR